MSYVSNSVSHQATSKLTRPIQAAIIPKAELFTQGTDVLARYFQLTLGRVVTSHNQLQTIYSVLKAISAIGNIIVVTFTTARGNENQGVSLKWRLTWNSKARDRERRDPSILTRFRTELRFFTEKTF